MSEPMDTSAFLLLIGGFMLVVYLVARHIIAPISGKVIDNNLAKEKSKKQRAEMQEEFRRVERFRAEQKALGKWTEEQEHDFQFMKAMRPPF